MSPQGGKKKIARFADEDGLDLAQSTADKNSRGDGDLDDDQESSADRNGDSNNNSSSSNAGNSNKGGNNVTSELQKLAAADNRNVRIWKIMVVLLISIAGALVSLGIHFYLKFQEEEDIKDSVSTAFHGRTWLRQWKSSFILRSFSSSQWLNNELTHSLTCTLDCGLLLQFNLFANTIEDVSKIQYKALFDAAQGLSNTITAEAIGLNMTFPFVTINNFEAFARDARIASKAELVSCSLVVQAADIPAFNQYGPPAAAKWIQTTQVLNDHLKENDDGNNVEMAPQTQILPFIYDTTYDISTGEQTVTPSTTDSEVLWQTSPLIENGLLLMSNLLSIQAGLVPGMDSPFVTIQKTKGTNRHYMDCDIDIIGKGASPHVRVCTSFLLFLKHCVQNLHSFSPRWRTLYGSTLSWAPNLTNYSITSCTTKAKLGPVTMNLLRMTCKSTNPTACYLYQSWIRSIHTKRDTWVPSRHSLVWIPSWSICYQKESTEYTWL